MKSLRRSLQFNFLLALVAMLTLVSCYQLEVVNSQALLENSGSDGKVVISVANFMGQPNRTVAPSQLAANDLRNASLYTLTLTGTSGRRELPAQNLTLTNGKDSIDNIPEGLWELTLKATNANSLHGLAAGSTILEGKTTVLVDNSGVAQASFILSPPETGEGSIHVSVNANSQNLANMYGNISRTRIRLFYKGTDTPVPGVIEDLYSGNTWSPIRRFPSNGPTVLPAGEYDLRVEFRKYDEYDAIWKETLIIEPGRLTDTTVTVPHIVKKLPDPGWATNLLTNVSEVENGLYEVTLNWNRVTNFYAKSYEIELKAINNNANITTDTAWNNNPNPTYGINGIPGSPHHFTNSINNYPVSLNGGVTRFDMNTNSIRLTLAAGRYVCRLRILGTSGNTGWIYGRIVEPKPAVPTIPPSDYFVTTALPANSFSATIKWNPVEYATTYEIESMLLTPGRVPPADISQFYSDQTFTRYPYTWRTGNSQFFFNKFSNNRPILFRVRATNSAGASDWRYYPSYLNETGAFLPNP